jgi:hypothetical protein
MRTRLNHESPCQGEIQGSGLQYVASGRGRLETAKMVDIKHQASGASCWSGWPVGRSNMEKNVITVRGRVARLA